jgi:exosortase
MATASAPTQTQKAVSNPALVNNWKSILLPYVLAIVAQLPMLLLYFKSLWERPHYQSFPFAIIASAALTWMRWPKNEPMPFHRSLSSDVLLVLGLAAALLGVVFVEPWFSAFSVLMLTTSLLARTYDAETKTSLWPCALPLFVCLALPLNYDTVIITRLQYYSAGFTSQLLDLIGLGHHLDGTVINVPGEKKYGVEEACSGVVSFFTLLAVTSAYVVWARRVVTPNPILATLLLIAGFLTIAVEFATIGLGYYSLVGIGLILVGILGFRAALLLLSAVFWALFMNTVRILLIPVADYLGLGIDLSHGIAHDILGYSVLIVGILMVLSTDQFLLFFFGPVEEAPSDARPLARSITNFWNRFVAGNRDEEDSSNRSRSRRSKRKPVGKFEKSLIWTTAIILLVGGLFQIVDVQRSLASPQYKVRFFDADVTVDFEESDLPTEIDETWKQVNYVSEDRSQGSDLGERSDVWQFRAPKCMAVASIDQTFPGWHELTTCYKNQGWNLVSRKRIDPEIAEGETPWPYIEAHFQKETGEKGYLLFSHFDAFGEPVDAPAKWGSINSFIIRARNRLSHRIRANLLQGEVYQTQVFLRSYNELDENLRAEIKDRYLKIRKIMLEKFKEKRAAEMVAP